MPKIRASAQRTSASPPADSGSASEHGGTSHSPSPRTRTRTAHPNLQSYRASARNQETGADTGDGAAAPQHFRRAASPTRRAPDSRSTETTSAAERRPAPGTGTAQRRRAGNAPATARNARAASTSEPQREAAQTGGAMHYVNRAINAVFGTTQMMWRMYVAALAVTGPYRMVRNTRDLVSYPGPTLFSIAKLSGRIDDSVVRQAKANVLERHGEFIPTDSACHTITPRVTFDSVEGIDAFAAGVRRAVNGKDNGQPKEMLLRPYAELGGSLHVAQHEYLHCFTHPHFVNAVRESRQPTSIEEGLTEHLADQLPGNPLAKFTPLDIMTLPNGKRLKAAAADLERAVGKETLQRAYFSGDQGAIDKVATAIVNIWPKAPTLTALDSIGQRRPRKRQVLAECFAGASLLHVGQLPDGWTRGFLPVYDFAQISAGQAEQMRRQAEDARERLGEAFDQAFCNFAPGPQKAALVSIEKDLMAHWKRVL
ncbi:MULTISPECIES: hypothetical protein [Ralstonia solanacearum species complex]|nr:hypothetical protein [Ralstonia solanacearum]AXV77953.1 hypothetical protein CJO76_13835 [Ralstonia solanacearum]AXV91979.1 hypothetical protein CJO79_13815 [Ralstonia solanacearum]AXW76865.1 hypothetical protein CJO97_13805 [Ralstonia solanacearum]BEU73146.1 hypothetical protein MAFF211271_27010 [Ralstonia pseudosolanacearum]